MLRPCERTEKPKRRCHGGRMRVRILFLLTAFILGLATCFALAVKRASPKDATSEENVLGRFTRRMSGHFHRVVTLVCPEKPGGRPSEQHQQD